MKRKSDPIALTASRFSALVGVDRNEILKRLEEAKAEPVGRKNGGDEYTLRDLFHAAIGGDIMEQRLRKLRAEADHLEHQLAVKRREYVPVAAVIRLGQSVMVAAKNHILGSPLPPETQDKILRELVALGDADWSHCE